jgi:hypothetical protein
MFILLFIVRVWEMPETDNAGTLGGAQNLENPINSARATFPDSTCGGQPCIQIWKVYFIPNHYWIGK